MTVEPEETVEETTDLRDPWERWDDETDVAYAAFIQYRDLGPLHRSLSEVSRQVGKSKTLLGRWSRRHSWVDRVNAWDTEIRLKAEARMIEEREQMLSFHAKVGRAGLNVVAEAIIGNPAKRIAPLDPAKLSPHEIARLAEVFSRLERQARGEPEDELVGVRGYETEEPIDPEKLVVLSEWARRQSEPDASTGS